MGVEVQRGDGGGGQHERLGPAQEGGPRGGIERARGLVEQGVVGGIGPAGVVVAVVAAEQVEEGGGVGVVAQPVREEDVEIAPPPLVEQGLELAVDQTDLEAEVAPPHFLHGLGDQAEIVGVGKSEGDRKQSAAARESRGGEQALGGGDVAAGLFRRRVTGRQRVHEGGGRGLAAEENFVRQRRAVDHEGERLAHAGVGERGAPGVEAEEEGVEIGIDAEEAGGLLAIGGDLARRQGLGDVALAGAEGAFLDVLIVGQGEMDLVQPHPGLVPVERGLGHNDALAADPFLQQERAARDHAAGPGPGRAAPVGITDGGDGAHVDRQPGRVGQQLEEIGNGPLQRDLQGPRIGGREADPGEIGLAAPVEGLRALDDVEEIGVVGGEGRGEDPPPGIHAVLGGERLAVGPLQSGAEMESVDEAVGGNFPALGERRFRVRGRIAAHQRLEKRGDDLALGDPGHDVRVEVGHVAAGAAVEDLGAVTPGDVGLVFRAGLQSQAHETHEKTPKNASPAFVAFRVFRGHQVF